MNLLFFKVILVLLSCYWNRFLRQFSSVPDQSTNDSRGCVNLCVGLLKKNRFYVMRATHQIGTFTDRICSVPSGSVPQFWSPLPCAARRNRQSRSGVRGRQLHRLRGTARMHLGHDESELSKLFHLPVLIGSMVKNEVKTNSTNLSAVRAVWVPK